MRGDNRSLVHGIVNLLLPIVFYDAVVLLCSALTVGNYDPWVLFLPMSILMWAPFASDALCVIIAAVRFKRRGRTRALLGLIFSVGGAALYYMLRFQIHFSLSGGLF